MSGRSTITLMRQELARLEARVAELEAKLGPDRPTGAPITLRAILDEVSAEFRVPVPEILSPWREERLLPARHAAMALARRFTKLSLPQIGRAMRRDHSTVLAGIAAHERREATSPEIAARIRAVSERLQRSMSDA
jgi:chromosomal replication initiation ATPase DnaA